MRLVIALLSCLFLTSNIFGKDPKNNPSSESEKETPSIVPFILLPSGHFLVNVKLNDKGPYQLIFDTGAPTLLLNNRIAKDSGIMKKQKGSMFSPFGPMGQVKIASLQIGEVISKNIPAVVVDHPTVNAFSQYYKKKYGPIDGIVGFPFFAKFKMTVDYQAKQLTFIPNNYKPTDVMESMMNAIMGASKNNKPKIVAATGYWGLKVTKATKDDSEGVDVSFVVPDSPAAKAGIKVGDRLLTIDGRWTDSETDTYHAAGLVQVGKTVPVEILRNKVKSNLKVTPIPGF